MKKQRNGRGTMFIQNSSQIIRRYWIGLAFIALFGLAIVAPTAEAAPMPQRTVPTATPAATATPPDDDDDNNNSDSVLELFDPTPTPEPIIDLDLGEESLGGAGGLENDSDDEENDSNQDSSFDEPTDELDDLPAFDNDFPFSEDALDGLVDTSFLNMFSGPDANSGIIDTLFRDTPVQIIGRDATGEWVQICCGEDRGNQGWVPAADIDFGFDFDAPDLELPVFGDDPFADENLLEDLNPDIEIAELELAMSLDSGNVRPGQVVELQFWVTNVGEVDATDVSLRNELPNILEFDSAVFSDGSLTETTNASNDDAPVFRIDWPEIAAGETLTATVIIQVSEDADYGIVVDNLAGVGASNAEIETAGVTLGTPPILPPDFRVTRSR